MEQHAWHMGTGPCAGTETGGRAPPATVTSVFSPLAIWGLASDGCREGRKQGTQPAHDLARLREAEVEAFVITASSFCLMVFSPLL